MKKLLAIATISAFVFSAANAIAQKKCGLEQIIEQKIAADPVLKEKYETFKQQQSQALQVAINTPSTAKTTATATIPVVFHFILTEAQRTQLGGDPGLHTRTMSQLDALNRDYNAANPDQSKIPAVFKPVFGNPQMTFLPARRTSGGAATSGVEIKIVSVSDFDVMSGNERKASTGLAPWDVEKYLNIWIVDISDVGVLGYAVSPQFSAWLNMPRGITIDYRAFGQKHNALTSGIDSGRTAVHEIGHFFTLNHIWGEEDDCSDDDGIGDTPQQDEANMGCPSSSEPNCNGTSGGEMYMNYMDYCNDKCLYMFTKGQVTVMQKEIAPGGASHELTTHPELTTYPTGVAGIEQTNDFIVFPNPTSGLISINFATTPAGLKSISIVNMVGQVVQTIQTASPAANYDLNLSGLSKGVYMVQCQFEEGMVTRKIVLQ